jgi:uncharacterized protein
VGLPHDRDDDPGLPLKLGPCSNGEHYPLPLSEMAREALRRARRQSEANARRAGMSRRDFLLSACGMATALLALDACSRESGRQEPGGRFRVPPESTVDADAARAAMGSGPFVFDVQGHLLDYDLDPATRSEPFFGRQFPQAG